MKVFTFALLVLLMSACGGPPAQKDLPSSPTAPDHGTIDHSKMGHGTNESSPDAANAPYELQFIDTMIVHHQGAIDMAQLAPTRAGHDELKKLAENIVADQQREIAQMRAWRDTYFKDAQPAINMELPGMHEGVTGMDMAKLDGLKETPFDLEFIRQMVPHHEGAVLMAKDLLNRQAPVNVELDRTIRKFAQSIADTQSQEIDQMKQWKAAWSQ